MTPMGCSLPGSSVHGILQARTLEWVSISFSRGSFQPRDWICTSCVSCIAGRFFTLWAVRWSFVVIDISSSYSCSFSKIHFKTSNKICADLFFRENQSACFLPYLWHGHVNVHAFFLIKPEMHTLMECVLMCQWGFRPINYPFHSEDLWI